ncbi:MAG: DUF4339 domain-containing protein [Planctomycetota bacterium]
MGIRFSCHGCGKPLNIKSELAGRRGVCPECQIRFRIPSSDAEYSSPVDSRPQHAAFGSSEQQEAASASVGVATAPSRTAVANGVAEATPLEATKTQEATTTQGPLTEQGPRVGPRGSDAPIDALSSDTEATWYVRPPSGGQYGPATGQVLKAWIEEGRVAKNALLWRDGWLQWRDASEALPEIASTLPGGGVETVGQQETDPVFLEGESFSSVADTSNVVSSAVNAGTLSGNSDIGSVRRKRSSNRLTLIAVLGVVAVGLCVTLAIVASLSG